MLRARPLIARSGALRSSLLRAGSALRPESKRSGVALVPSRALSDGNREGLSHYLIQYPLNIDSFAVPDFAKPLVDFGVDAMTAMHSSLHLPWWATVVLSAVTLRAVMLPLTVYQFRKAMSVGRLQRHLQLAQAAANQVASTPIERLMTFTKKERALLKKYRYGEIRRWWPIMVQLAAMITMGVSNRR
jgi:membrane protein insertase Oxa1/YidC/SpoIIIJ